MIPLTISKTNIYYLNTKRPTWRGSPGRTTSLAACSLRTGKILYSTHLLDEDPDSVPTSDFKMLSLRGREYIIHLGAEPDGGPPQPVSAFVSGFAIIDTATGRAIQHIKHAGTKGQDVCPKLDSSTFALWSPPTQYFASGVPLPANNFVPAYGLIHMFTLQEATGKFALTSLISLSLQQMSETPLSTFAVHPFTLRGFDINHTGLRTVLLEPYRDADDDAGGTFFDLSPGRRYRVDAKYKISIRQDVTLPPREGAEATEKGKRRRCSVGSRLDSFCENLVVVDERRVAYLDRFSTGTLWVFGFGANW
jgi:hypothetical protein